jgi:hypothetical protein
VAANPYPYLSSLGVYDTAKFNDTTNTSPKYVFLRNAAKYGVATPEQRAALVAALKADPSGYFANATLNNDILSIGANPAASFNGVTAVDVIRDFGGANGVAWQPVGTGTSSGSTTTGSTTGSTTTDGTGGTSTSSDYAAQLQEAINSILTSVFSTSYASGGTTSTGGTALPTGFQELYDSVLANPTSMDAETTAKMKEAQKESLLGTRASIQDEAAQNAASRGMYNSGWVDQQNLAANDAFTSDLTKAYRDIDIDAAKTNFENKLSTLNAAAPIYEFSQTLPLNWYTALQNALLGNYNYGLDAAKLQEQMQEYMGNWLNSSTE